MQFLRNRKGFSLVELMIVVVIMGILVSVAIPLYDSLTDNARRRTCQYNQNTVRACFNKWVLMDATNSASSLFKTDAKTFNGKTQNAGEVLHEDFIGCFEDGTLPECPEEGHYYIIKRIDNETIDIQCMGDNNQVDEDHQEDTETETN
ncbi:MAG: prepilin-type N-terminal cleavage/methylation domain-containing protein [Clostridia bacterium]|nr:prepilin-type N-terminal cleavage/methylation domain-containing protein [Clostridia bacterium]